MPITWQEYLCDIYTCRLRDATVWYDPL